MSSSSDTVQLCDFNRAVVKPETSLECVYLKPVKLELNTDADEKGVYSSMVLVCLLTVCVS